MATPLNIEQFRGINTLHTRGSGQLSAGKNFVCPLGSLKTRDGSSLLANANFTSGIRSLHAAAQSGIARLLVEEGSNLWHQPTTGGDFVNLKSDCATAGFSSCHWQNYIILVNGTDHLAYDIAAGTIAALGGSPPPMQYTMEWKGTIFGWAPDHSDAHKVWFCGYQGSTTLPSKDSWDTTKYFTNVGGNASNPVLQYIPFGTHILALTPQFFFRVYGSNENDFASVLGGKMSIVNPRCAASCDKYVAWLGRDEGSGYRVYAYTGTIPVPISAAIEGLFPDLCFDNPWAINRGGNYWLFLPDTANQLTTVLIFSNQEWYFAEYPAAFHCAVQYNEYLGLEYLHMGLSDGRIAKIDGSVDTAGKPVDWGNPIKTEFSIGGIRIEARKVMAKNIWVNALPGNDFDLDVYAFVDDKDEKGPKPISFGVGNAVDRNTRFGALKGRNLTLRFETFDKVDKIQSMTIATDIKELK